MTVIDQIHQAALAAAGKFKRAEAGLIEALQKVDESRAFMKLGYTSLFNYSVQGLGLSESTAASFVTVSRKARVVPELQSAIRQGELSVSKARRITPVLTQDNAVEWVEMAKTLPQRKLEAEVARVLPREEV